MSTVLPHPRDREVASFPLDDALRIVVDELLASFDETTGRWQPTWHSAGLLPHNATTGANYHGINAIMLWAHQLGRKYDRPAWATYKQWQEVGAQVQRGAKAARVIRWVALKSDDVDDEGNGRGKLVPKVYAVFNTAQVDNAPDQPDENLSAKFGDWFDDFDRFVDAVPATVIVGLPCYVPDHDIVQCPSMSSFKTPEQWAHAISHELADWTAKRLDRERASKYNIEAYAYEELVADISAALTTAWFRVPDAPLRDDHVRYIKSWIEALNNDPKILMAAAQHAQAATNHLIEYSHA